LSKSSLTIGTFGIFARSYSAQRSSHRRSAPSLFSKLFCYFPKFPNVLLAMLSGFLVSMGFPGDKFPYLSAWWLVPFGFIPLFLAIEFLPNESNWLRGKPLSQRTSHGKALRFWHSFFLCWIFGSTLASVAFFWVTVPMIFFGKLPPALAYSIFALYSVLSGSFFALVLLPFSFNAVHTFSRLAKPYPLFCLAVFSCALELVIPRFFYWTIGSLLHDSAPLRQWSGLFGFHFLGIFVYYTCAAFAQGIYQAAQGALGKFLLQLGLQPALWGTLIALGTWRESVWNSHIDAAPKRRIAFIQPNFTFEQLSSNSFQSTGAQEQSLDTLLEMSEQVIVSATDRKPDLLVWPESVSPTDFNWAPEKQQVVKDFIARMNVPLLNQTVSFDEKELQELGYQKATMYSESNLMRTDGSVSEPYRKWVPIPFGETVPLEDHFPQFGKLVRKYVGNTSKVGKGTSTNAIPFADGAQVAPLICFDSISPELTRKQVNLGDANLFVNQANFIWMLHSNAGAEFRELNRFRGIENGRSIVMVANTGPSTAFDPTGKEIYTTTKLVSKHSGYVDVPIVDEDTLYSQFGNAPTYGLFAACVAFFLLWPQNNKRKRFF
jgi:apolipoprotein N-acyltransferase